MLRVLIFSTVLLGLVLAHGPLALAEDAPDLSGQYTQIQETYSQAYRDSKGERTAMLAAMQQREKALKALVDSAKDLESESLGYEDHLVLARSLASLRRYQEAIPHCEAALAADPQQVDAHILFVTNLIATRQTDRAVEAFEVAAGQFPDAQQLKRLHNSLASLLRVSGNHADSAAHLSKYLDLLIEDAAANPARATQLSRTVDQLISTYTAADQTQKGLDALDACVASLEKLPESPQVKKALIELFDSKVRLVAQMGQMDKARELLAAKLAAAEARDVDSAEAGEAAAHLIYLLRLNAEFTTLSDSAEASLKAWEKWQSFATDQVNKFPNDQTRLSAWIESTQQVITMLGRNDQVKEAMDLLKQTIEQLASIATDDQAAKQLIARHRVAFQRHEQRLGSDLLRAELIGKPAFPVDADAWVNGSSLTEADLQGKVVLLDFWAVWCGPCIATFPHLIEWNSRFESEGLVMIGVTRYYSYGWDAEQKKASRGEEVSHEIEQQAVAEFAKHHGLTHRLVLSPPDSQLNKQYGVTGIPQVVLIDRSGVIRLIKVGSGEANAKAIEEMLVKLLAEPAPEAD
jgi:thiol-disulfide isomerase/thioredoxin